MPRLAAGAIEEAVGLLVAGELLLGRVPLQRPLQLVGDDAQVAHGHGVDGQLDVAERLLAGLDAMDEVAVDAALALVGRHGLRRPLLARRADDLQVAHAGVVVVQQHAVGIAVGQVLAVLVVVIDDFHGLQFPDVDGERGPAEMVRAPVGHAAAGIVAVGSPATAAGAEVAVAARHGCRAPRAPGRATCPSPCPSGTGSAGRLHGCESGPTLTLIDLIVPSSPPQHWLTIFR